MSERKTPVLLRRGPVSGNVMALLSYRYKPVVRGREVHEVLEASSKQDVTADFTALMLEELLDPDAPDIVGILDGVANGQLLTADEKAQVRAFRERLAAACERHNEREHGAST